MALLDQIVHLDSHLRDPEAFSHEPRVGVSLDPVALADSLEPEKTLLSESLETLTAEQRATESALDEKDAIVNEVRRLYVAAAKVIEGFYRLAGLEKEAERLRLTVRRRAGNDDDELPTEEQVEAQAEEQTTQD